MVVQDQLHENFQFPEEVLPKGNSLYDLSKQDNHSLKNKSTNYCKNQKHPQPPNNLTEKPLTYITNRELGSCWHDITALYFIGPKSFD